MDRRDPNVLFAATNDFQRFPWTFRDGGPGSAIYKTTDAGAHWTKLSGGLPSGKIGLSDWIFAAPGPTFSMPCWTISTPILAQKWKRRKRCLATSGRWRSYRTDDSGATWRKMNAANEDVSRKTGLRLQSDSSGSEQCRANLITGSNLISSEDGGKSWAGLGQGGAARNDRRPFRRAFGDFRTLWIDPEDSDHMMVGSDGGVFVSYDGGKTCDHFSNLQLGEVYALGADMEKPYRIFEGLQDHESWMGPEQRTERVGGH